MRVAETFECKIYLGLKEDLTELEHPVEEVYEVLQEYCNAVGFCITVTPLKYIYKDGNEDGCVVGLINYPRFAMSREKLKTKAIEIGYILLNKFRQHRLSVVCSDSTYMLEV